MARDISIEINHPDGRGVANGKITYTDETNGGRDYKPDFTDHNGWVRGLRFYDRRTHVYVNGRHVGYFDPRDHARYTFVYYG